MTNEQKEAIELLERIHASYFLSGMIEQSNYIVDKAYETDKAIDTVLSLIKEQDKKIEHLKENIDYKTLCDFLMSSVSDEEEPIWTEKHIEELLDNFEVRWKDAHK